MSRANDAWESLLSTHATLMKRFAAEDMWGDLSMREYDVVYTLSKCPEPQRTNELNRHVLLSQPAVSRLVDRLAERGFIERLADREIGRRHARDVAHAMTVALTPGELGQLEAICRKLAIRGESR